MRHPPILVHEIVSTKRIVFFVFGVYGHWCIAIAISECAGVRGTKEAIESEWLSKFRQNLRLADGLCPGRHGVFPVGVHSRGDGRGVDCGRDRKVRDFLLVPVLEHLPCGAENIGRATFEQTPAAKCKHREEF
jgi:hypothetical protein